LTSRQLNIGVLWLYDSANDKLLTGGMERWCRDVARLVREHGYAVKIWQKSPAAFRKQLDDGIVIQGLPASLSFAGNRELARAIQRMGLTAEPWLFVSQEILAFAAFPRAVAVNHGIWWDGDFPWWKKTANKSLQRRLILRAMATICVDTNYINWCHAELTGRSVWGPRLYYVPNYADTNAFMPAPALSADAHRSPVLLFPRRVEGADLNSQGRGAGLFIQAVERLEAEGMRPRLLFAGRGSLQKEIMSWAALRGTADRVEVFEAALDEMPSQYQRADVVVVPSIAHEGTSLSAIEGMVSGKPVVVTHIGGLGNVVLNGLNGYVCDLTPDSLAQAIRIAVASPPFQDDPRLLELCRSCFGKERWGKQVWSILESKLGL